VGTFHVPDCSAPEDDARAFRDRVSSLRKLLKPES
jgi:hypothetical protein